MCTAKIFKSPTCNHWWSEILKPCGEGKNFNTCASFENGIARLPRDHPRYKAEKNTCPKCDKKDDYDGGKIRIVKDVRYGYKVGTGASKSDFGFDTPGLRWAKKSEYGFESPSFRDVFLGGCAVM